MYNNLEHSANIYYRLIEDNGYNDLYNRFQSYLVVIVVDMSVIAFIVKARITESKVFAWLLFVVNILFFDVFTSIYNVFTAQESEFTIRFTNDVVAKVIFSAIFSYSIHRFSLLYYNSMQEKGSLEHFKAISEQLEARNEQLELSILHKEDLQKQLLTEIEQIATSEKQLQSKVSEMFGKVIQYEKELTCDVCNEYVGTSIRSLNAHKGVCKQKHTKA